MKNLGEPLFAPAVPPASAQLPTAAAVGRAFGYGRALGDATLQFFIQRFQFLLHLFALDGVADRIGNNLPVCVAFDR